MTDREIRRDGCACDLLAAYEMGMLEVDEKKAFEQHLDDCPECLEEVYAMAPATVAMHEEPGRYARASATVQPGLIARLGSALAELIRPRVLAPAAIAAALALVFIVPALQDAGSFGELAVVDPLPYARIEVRAGSDEPAQLFQDAMTHYAEQRYGQASDLLRQAEELQDSWPTDRDPLPAGLHDQTRIYRGVSLLLSGRAESSIAPLLAATAAPLPPLADRARWYLAQSYLLVEQPQAALDVLTLLLQSPVYGDRARMLSEEIAIQ